MGDERPLHERLIELAVYVPVGVATSLVEELPTLADKGRERLEKEVQLARTMGQLAVKQARRRIEKLSGATPAPRGGGAATAGPATGPTTGRAGAPRTGPAASGPVVDEPGPSGPVANGRARSGPAANGRAQSRRVSKGAAGSGPAANGPAGSSPVDSEPAASGPAPRERPETRPGDSLPTPTRPDPPDVGSLAIPAYDTLAASQVVQRLSSLRPDELEAVGAYESATRGRRTILHRIAQLSSGARATG